MTDRALVALAVDYGWWLTGDQQAARDAAERALAHPAVRSAPHPARREVLLKEVRAAAPASSMRPASEVALLHDRCDLPLEVSAALAGVDPGEVGTELAHGRLEALADRGHPPPAHPERLGGLAVGNPADVAHARQCADCELMHTLLLRGRDEVAALPGTPAEVHQPLPGTPAEVHQPLPDTPAEVHRPLPDTPAAASEPTETRPLGWRAPALAVAVAAGALAAASVPATILAAAVLAVVGVVAVRPAWAAYILLTVTPLVAGMDRGALLPVLRPHEALVAVLGAGLVAYGIGRIITGRPIRVHVTAVHLTLGALAICASLLPLLWLVARRATVTTDDVLHAAVLWKYLAVFLLVRVAVRTEAQVARCLWLAMAGSAVVALVAILQSLGWLGVPQLLAAYYAPFGNERVLTINRGTSTLASSIAVGALMSYTAGIALGWLLRGSRHRRMLLAAGVLFVLGALASGQFSGAIALAVAVVAVGWITGQLRRALVVAVPAAALGALLLWPVIGRRLSGFTSPGGLPSSWVGRLENLRTHFWPELFSRFNWVLGVRPSARVPAPESWRDWVWIESGHTWLLWSGGVPLVAAFVAFVWASLRATARVARERTDAIGIAGVASFASLWTMTVLMILDVHLTLRGSADLLFPLLALALTGYGGRLGKPVERTASVAVDGSA